MKSNLRGILCFIALWGNAGANPILLRGVGEVLKNPMGTQALSRIFGVSQTRLSNMSAEQRGQFLEKKLNGLREQGREGLATDINALFSKMSHQPLKRMQGEIERLATRMPGKKISVRKLLGPSKQGDALNILRARVNKGELASSAVEEFSATVRAANKALGLDILGKSAGNCLKNFSPGLVGNFMTLVSSLKSPAALTSVESAFRAMVSKAEKLYGESLTDAQKRVCGLAGQGFKCHALAPRMCAL